LVSLNVPEASTAAYAVETFAHGGDSRKSGADFERDAGKDQL
jgi:hypothetical protein